MATGRPFVPPGPVHPRLLPPPTVHLRKLQPRYLRGEAALGCPLLWGRGGGVKRSRPPLRALRPPEPERGVRPWGGHKGIRGWHGRGRALRDKDGPAQQRGAKRADLRGVEADAAPNELRLAVRPR